MLKNEISFVAISGVKQQVLFLNIQHCQQLIYLVNNQRIYFWVKFYKNVFSRISPLLKQNKS